MEIRQQCFRESAKMCNTVVGIPCDRPESEHHFTNLAVLSILEKAFSPLQLRVELLYSFHVVGHLLIKNASGERFQNLCRVA